MKPRSQSIASLLLLLSTSLLFLRGNEALTPSSLSSSSSSSSNRRRASYYQSQGRVSSWNNGQASDEPRRRRGERRGSSQMFVSSLEEQTGQPPQARSKASSMDRKSNLSPEQIEREIVQLGRKGRLEQALEIYNLIKHPTIRQVNAIIDACSRSMPVRLDLAFEILEKSPVDPNVYTFGSLMNVCARAGSVQHAVQLLKSMEDDYGVAPNAVVYNTAVSACARADPPRPAIALKLLHQARDRGLRTSVVGYNAAISAASRAGDWEGALQLLTQMENAAANADKDEDANDNATMLPRPDAVSYGTVLAAFEKAQQWNRILEYAEYMQSKGMVLDGLAISSVLHACQSLALADEAVRYLNMMKETDCCSQKRQTFGWDVAGARSPLCAPDAVAYLLAVSACARGGAWLKGIQLLDDYCKTPSIRNTEVDVSLFTAAIKGCEYAGRWEEAFLLLDSMRKNNIQPNVVALASAIGACATACAKIKAMHSDANEIPSNKLEPQIKALRLLKLMGKDETIVSPNTLVYNAAIRVCAEAHDLKYALRVFDAMQKEGIEPSVYTFGALMTACERVGSAEGMSKVFVMLRKQGLEANDVIYGAAISCCRKAGEDERAMLLLQKMVKEGFQPNSATFNTALIAQTESRNTANLARLYKFLCSNENLLAQANRQTFNIIIRAFAEKKQPKEAESVLRLMHKAGFVPDVDLYTLVVSAYERTGQPLQALRLMESMNEEGYAFYEDKVLNAAFKRALKMANILGRRWSTTDAEAWSILEEQDEAGLDVGSDSDDTAAFGT